MIFGVHSGPGDAFVLLFQHLVGILVGWVQHPDFEEEIQKALLREEFSGEVGKWLDRFELPLVPLPDYRLYFADFPSGHTLTPLATAFHDCCTDWHPRLPECLFYFPHYTRCVWQSFPSHARRVWKHFPHDA